MRRRLLSAAAAAIVLLGAVEQPAFALFGVGDIVFDPASYGELVQEAKNGLEQLKWLSDIYGTAQKDLQTLINFYNLFAHITDVAQLAQVLNSEFIHSPMLANAIQLEQTFRGLGLHTSLGGKIQTVMNQIRYYTPSDKDFAGFKMNQRTTALAGQIQSAQDAYDAEGDRLAGLDELKAAVVTADPKRIADLTARGTIETASAIAESNKLMAAGLMQNAQDATDKLQREQARRFSVDQLQTGAQAAVEAANRGEVNLVVQ